MSKQRTILKAASELPPKQARRVAGAIAAAGKQSLYDSNPNKGFKQFVRAVRPNETWESDTPDDLLESAAIAMQRAVEKDLVSFILQAAENLADSTNAK